MKPAYKFIIQTLMLWLRALQDRLGIAPTPSEPTPLIPRQTFMDFPNYWKASISPDGKYLSYLKLNRTTYKGNLHLLEVDKLESGLTDPLSEGKPCWNVADPSNFQWLFDGKTILTTGHNDKGQVIKLFDTETDKETAFNFGFAASIKGLSQLRPEEVLVKDFSEDGKAHFYIIRTNGTKQELLVTGDFKGRYFDHSFKAKLGSRPFGPDGVRFEAFKKAPNGSWEQESFWKTKDPIDLYMNAVPQHINLKGDAFYWINSWDYKYVTLMESSLVTGESKVVFSPQKGDVIYNEVVYDPRDQTPAWVITEYDRQNIFVIKPELNRDIENLNKATPGNIYFKSASTDFNLWVIQAREFDQVPKWFLYDRRTKKAQFLFKEMEKLSKFKLSQMYPLEVSSSDGLKVVCFYCVPSWLDTNKNGVPDSPLPTIVYNHGGPWLSKADWNGWLILQILSNRGFVSVECNYRGGSGYGKEFALAGRRQIGLKQIDDIMAGLNELVRLGVTDPGKMAVWGESHGAYCASMMQVRYPDRFKCAVPAYGVHNLVEDRAYSDPNIGPEFLAFDRQMQLDPNDPKDLALLRQLSPVLHLKNITKPPRSMLVPHGLLDQSCPINQSEGLVKGLKELNIPVTFGVFPDEAHAILTLFNNWAYKGMVENFLHRCVGAGRAEPMNLDFPYSSLQIREAGILTELKSKEVPWTAGGSFSIPGNGS